MIIRITMTTLTYKKQAWIFGDMDKKKWHEYFQEFLAVWGKDHKKIVKVETNKSPWPLKSSQWAMADHYDRELIQQGEPNSKQLRNLVFFSNDKNKNKAFKIFEETANQIN